MGSIPQLKSAITLTILVAIVLACINRRLTIKQCIVGGVIATTVVAIIFIVVRTLWFPNLRFEL